VALVFIVAAYIVVGGLIFSALEKNHEWIVKEEVLNQISAFIDENSCLSEDELGKLNVIFKEMRIAGLSINASGELVANTGWDIRTALFVSLQLIATIGFPSTAPQSPGGRAFTVPFAVLGIPLFLITAIGMGTLLNSFAEFVRTLLIRKCFGRCAPDCGAMVFRTIIIAVVGIILLLLIPSIIFAQIEPWTYGDAFYFSFITLATIGFGDLLPSYNEVPWMSTTYRNWYRLAIAFWILLLSAWFAGVIVSIQTSLAETALRTEEQLSRKLQRKGVTSNDVNTNVQLGLQKNQKLKNQRHSMHDHVAESEPYARISSSIYSDARDPIPEGIMTRIAV